MLTLFVTVDDLDSLRVRNLMAVLGPRALVRVDPDGQRVLQDLNRLESAGHAGLFFYVTDERQAARLAYCVSLYSTPHRKEN